MAGFEDDAAIEALAAKRPGKATTTQPDPEKPATAKPAAAAAAEAADLVALITDKPAEVLLNAESLEKLYATVSKEIAAFKPDLSSEASRGRIKSLAYKIVRTRTTLDAAGKDHTADLRASIDKVNEVRAGMRTKLEELEDLARKPLTDWEEEQAKRAQARAGILQQMTKAAAAQHMSAPDLKDLQIDIEAIVLDPDLWGEDLQMVTDRQAEVVDMIDAKIIAEEARQRTATVEAENQALRAAAEAAAPTPTADPNPPGADPVYEQRETPPLIGQPAPPAAGTTGKVLSPVQQARRLVLPPLAALGIEGETAKALILAIEAGQLPGITATYLET